MSSLSWDDAEATSAGDLQRFLVALIALCTIGISAWVLIIPPARSYEELYGAYPDAFWALFAVGFAAAVIVFVMSAIRDDEYWKLALTFVCVIYFLFNLLPLFRGWAMYGRGGADVLAHIGYAKTLLATNYLPANDFYPSVHVLLAEFRMFGVPFRTVSPMLSGFFSVVYLLGIYLLMQQLTGKKRIGVATLAIAVVPLYSKFQHSFHPAIFSFMMFPAYLYVFDRYRTTESMQYLGLTLLLSLVLIIFHPVTSIYALVALFVSIAARLLYGRVSRLSFDYRNDVPVLLFLATVWAIWYARFPGIREGLETAVSFGGGGPPSVASSYGGQQLAASHSLQQAALGFVDNYGPIFFVCTLAAIAALISLLRLWNGTSKLPEIWLSTQFTAGVVISLVTILTYVIAYHPVRNSRYMILMGTLLAGLLLYWLLHAGLLRERRLQRTAAVVVVVLLLATVPVATTNSYHSWTHMTHTEKDGTEWFYEHASPDNLAVSHGLSAKMQMYVRGSRYDTSRFVGFGDDSPMPRYFGYRTHDRVGQVVGETPTYIVTKEFDTEFYKALKKFVRKESIVYTEATLERLDRDPTVDKIYSNGDYTVRFVNESVRANATGEQPSSERRDGRRAWRGDGPRDS